MPNFLRTFPASVGRRCMSTALRPPFTQETATAKVRLAQDLWNSKIPERVAKAYTPDSVWVHRASLTMCCLRSSIDSIVPPDGETEPASSKEGRPSRTFCNRSGKRNMVTSYGRNCLSSMKIKLRCSSGTSGMRALYSTGRCVHWIVRYTLR